MPLRFILSIVAFCLGLLAAPAHAKRGLFSQGDALFEVAELPANVVAADPQLKGWKAGHKCSHVAVLGADAWVWGCSLVGMADAHNHLTLPEALAARLAADPRYAFAKAQRNAWNRHGFWMLSTGLLGFTLIRKLIRRKKDAAAQPASAADRAHADTVPA